MPLFIIACTKKVTLPWASGMLWPNMDISILAPVGSIRSMSRRCAGGT